MLPEAMAPKRKPRMEAQWRQACRAVDGFWLVGGLMGWLVPGFLHDVNTWLMDGL